MRQWRGLSLAEPINKRVVGSVEERLRARLKVDPQSGCHQWTGWRSPSGYGYLNVTPGKRVAVHRLAWEIANDRPVPEGMFVMHTCDNPACCNPDHLKLGTPAENVQDRLTKKRGKGSRERDLERYPQWRNPNARA